MQYQMQYSIHSIVDQLSDLELGIICLGLALVAMAASAIYLYRKWRRARRRVARMAVAETDDDEQEMVDMAG